MEQELIGMSIVVGRIGLALKQVEGQLAQAQARIVELEAEVTKDEPSA